MVQSEIDRFKNSHGGLDVGYMAIVQALTVGVQLVVAGGFILRSKLGRC